MQPRKFLKSIRSVFNHPILPGYKFCLWLGRAFGLVYLPLRFENATTFRFWRILHFFHIVLINVLRFIPGADMVLTIYLAKPAEQNKRVHPMTRTFDGVFFIMNVTVLNTLNVYFLWKLKSKSSFLNDIEDHVSLSS